jgi:hypothetical protein
MMSRTFGAPFGGTTRIGQLGVDCAAFGAIWPVKVCGGGGKYRPSMVVVASGEPEVPLICGEPPGTAEARCAWTGATLSHMKAARLARAMPPRGRKYLLFRLITSLPIYKWDPSAFALTVGNFCPSERTTLLE